MEHKPWKPLSLAAIAAASAAVATSACDQPRVACVTGRGDFAAKYTLVSGTGPCAELKGDVLGVQTYNGVGADHPDLKDISLAIRASSLGEKVQHAEDLGVTDPDATHHPYAWGKFTSAEPGKDDFCAAPSLAPAEQALPTVPAVPPDPANPDDPGAPEQPATHVKYEWSGLRVYVTAAATGTQFAADLTYTQDDCTAQYHAVAVYPAVACGDANGQPDDRLCAAEADPDAGSSVGSGINPDFPVRCDPDLLLCVLAGEPPALR